MAILFDWYENPKTSEQQGEENMLHPRLRLNGKVSTAQLRARIQKYCTLTETDVIAVLDALSHAMGEELAEGRQVHLDGIGFFRPNLVSTEPVTEKTKRKNTKVRLKGIVYPMHWVRVSAGCWPSWVWLPSARRWLTLMYLLR